MEKKLSEVIQELKMFALREVRAAKKRKHPKYRSGQKYWEGMAQGLANAARLAAGRERIHGPQGKDSL